MSKTVAQRMATLFAGFLGAHGTHGEPQQDPDSLKWHIKKTARTVPGPATVELWEKHLSGERPLGVAPIREDGTCLWGSGDVDDYEIDIIQLVQAIERAKLPLVPCYSKSGGVHLFLFLSEPAPAVEVQRYLRDVLARLGYANSEVFPKQTEILADRGDKPNWIVMPYFGGTYDNKLRMQVGVKASGGEQTVQEFLALAEERRQPRSALAARARSRPAPSVNGTAPPGTGVAFSDGPPCLQHLVVGGIKPGYQNNTLLMMGIYFKKTNPSDWEALLEQANQDHLDPPGSSEGLASVIRSLRSKDYLYTCKTEPMKSHCNAAVCRARRYGVGDEGAFPAISGISKLDTDPPIWFVNVEDSRLEVNTEELQDYRRFHAKCMSELNRCYMAIKQSDWFTVLSEAMRDVHLVPAPQEVGRQGIFHERLEEFLTNRQRGTSREDLLRGRPWEDEEAGRHYFRLRDLSKFLEREGDKTTSRGQMTEQIKRFGGGDHFFNIKGHGVNVWWVPSRQFRRPPQSDSPSVPGVPV
jgi:hypothetical protein